MKYIKTTVAVRKSRISFVIIFSEIRLKNDAFNVSMAFLQKTLQKK